MPDAIRSLTEEEIHRLAARAVDKIDLLGPRGTTLCSMEEIEAMACLIVLSGVLPSVKDRHQGAAKQALEPPFKTTRSIADAN